MSTHLAARDRLRRYPALTFLVVSGILATLLPSALLIPLSGPSVSAELAPVPGKSDGAGDLSSLSEASTGGLGSGGGLGGHDIGAVSGGRDGVGQPPGGTGRNLRDRRCVGKPPRQTEDPLSPPCVAYFDGDNGGATAKGVTRNEVRIVLQLCGEPGVVVDYDDEDDPNARPSVRAYAEHFNSRYQLYGRRAHFYDVMRDCTEADATDRAPVQRIDEDLAPFAFIPDTSNYPVADEAARLGMVNLVMSSLRRFTEERAPFVYSIYPDVDEQVTSMAEFVCRRLAGRPARYSGDAVAQGTTRQFGVYYRVPSDPARDGSAKLRDELRRRCGIEATDYSGEDWSNTAPGVAARMRNDGVTSVIAMEDHLWPSIAASSIGWHPEWVVVDAGRISNSNVRSFPPDQIRNSLGMSFRRRLGLLQEQPAHTAAEDGCRGCGDHTDPVLYEKLLFVFRGIQAAGPRLTPHNFDRGLHALEPHRSIDPYRPAAYLGPGDHYWFKDAMAWWWDPAGRPPGSRANGCWRLVEDGARYRTEDWRQRGGDVGFMGSDGREQPCQGGG